MLSKEAEQLLEFIQEQQPFVSHRIEDVNGEEQKQIKCLIQCRLIEYKELPSGRAQYTVLSPRDIVRRRLDGV